MKLGRGRPPTPVEKRLVRVQGFVNRDVAASLRREAQRRRMSVSAMLAEMIHRTTNPLKFPITERAASVE